MDDLNLKSVIVRLDIYSILLGSLFKQLDAIKEDIKKLKLVLNNFQEV